MRELYDVVLRPYGNISIRSSIFSSSHRGYWDINGRGIDNITIDPVYWEIRFFLLGVCDLI